MAKLFSLLFSAGGTFIFLLLGLIGLAVAVVGLTAVIVGAVFLLAYICYRMVFYSKPRDPVQMRKLRLINGEDYEPFLDEMHAWMKAAREYPHEDLVTYSHDGLTLHGYYYEQTPGAPIEIQFHGYRGDADRDLGGAIFRAFAVGRNALVIDHRASGRSDGNVISFGILEHRDCLAWVDRAIERFGPEVELHLTGISMGAATVLMAAGEPLPDNVKSVLADCPYSSPREIIRKVMRDKKYPVPLLYPFVRMGARVYGKFRLESCSPIEAVSRARVPIILYHGESDAFVPCDMSRALYDACASEKKRLVTVPNAAHALAYSVDKENYLKTLKEFIAECN